MKFEEIIKELNPKINAIAYKIAKSNNYIEVNDVIQEIHLHLWEKFRNNELEGYTNSYLLQSCWFFMKNFLRKLNSRTNCLSLDEKISEDENLSLLEQISNESNVDELLDYNITIDTIKSAGLSERESAVFDYLLKGYTLREIGSNLGISHVMVSKIQNSLKQKAFNKIFSAA